MKIFVFGERMDPDNKDQPKEFKNKTWIVDTLKNEIVSQFPEKFTNDPLEADIIWFLAPWKYNYWSKYNLKYVKMDKEKWNQILLSKKVVFTMHHVDPQKIESLKEQFSFMRTYGNRIHAICRNTQMSLENYFPKDDIFSQKFWVNSSRFYQMPEHQKINLRKKYNFNSQSFLIGSFQKDSEGNTDLPKLSKGPDLFVKIIQDMLKTNKNIEVVLTGLRRNYLIKELEKINIKYHYFNMVSLEELNELYNCLNLYLIPSRCEGGPYTIFEAGMSKTPLISTNVGVAPELCHSESLFNADNWNSYKQAVPKVDFLYENVQRLSTDEYKEEFLNSLIED